MPILSEIPPKKFKCTKCGYQEIQLGYMQGDVISDIDKTLGIKTCTKCGGNMQKVQINPLDLINPFIKKRANKSPIENFFNPLKNYPKL